MNHTKGPWEADELLVHSDADEVEFIVVFGSEGHGMGRVGHVYADAGSNTRSELEANARLIAKAPDMMLGLQTIKNAVGRYHEDIISTEDLLDSIAFGLDLSTIESQ